MVISIHQPNFMPWYPFFDKIKKSDKFVLLVHCQFEKNGFQNRFNIDNKWYTMRTYKGLEPINKKKYVSPFEDWDKLKKSLNQYKSILENFDSCISEDLYLTNSNLISKICNIMDIKTELIFDYPTKLKSTERLVDICKKFGASSYIAGSSGKNYMDLDLFSMNGIDVSFQETKIEDKVPILEKIKKIY